MHERVEAKLAQHETVRRNLFAFGWTSVRVHAFVIGHTGVMRQGNGTSLTRVGVSPCRVTPFLSALAMSSLRKSAGILAEFPSMRSTASHSADDAINSAGHNHDDHDAHMTDNGGSSPHPHLMIFMAILTCLDLPHHIPLLTVQPVLHHPDLLPAIP